MILLSAYGERGDIADWEYPACGLIRGEIRCRPHRIGKNDRPPASKRLVRNETPRFAPIGGQDQNIRRGVGGRHFRLIAKAEQVKRDTGPARGSGHLMFERARTRHQDCHPATFSLQPRGGGNEVEGALERHQLAGEEGHFCFVSEAEPRSQCNPRSFRGMDGKPFRVDTMRRKKHPQRRIMVMPPIGARALAHVERGIEKS